MGQKGPKAKPMAGLFKMKYQNKGGVAGLMKALVGDQHKLPDHLKKAIKDAPGKSYGSKNKALMKEDPKTKKPTDKNRTSVGRGGKDVVLSETDKVVSQKDPFSRGRMTEYEQVTQTVEKGADAPTGSTMADRQGRGRKGTKTYQRLKGQKGAYTMVGSTVEGSRTKGGRAQYRDASDTGTKDPKTGKRTYKSQGSTAGKNRVLIEDRLVKGPKSKGIEKQKITTAEISRKNLGVRKPNKTASKIKSKGVTTSGKISTSGNINELRNKRNRQTKGKANN